MNQAFLFLRVSDLMQNYTSWDTDLALEINFYRHIFATSHWNLWHVEGHIAVDYKDGCNKKAHGKHSCGQRLVSRGM